MNNKSMKTLYRLAVKREKSLKSKTKLKFGLTKEIMNLEELFKEDESDGSGIIMDTSEDYSDIGDEARLKDMDGIFSSRFGIRSDDTALTQSKRFRCKCGETKEPLPGKLCKFCNTYTANRFAKRGWFILEKFKVFNPEYFIMLKANLAKNLRFTKADIEKNILNYVPNKIDDINILDLQNKNNLIKFIKKYVAPEAVEFFINNIDKAMTSKIPVINKNYRHYIVSTKLNGEPSVQNHVLNSYYVMINNRVHAVNSARGQESETWIVEQLGTINKVFLQIHDELMNQMAASKKSDIRAKLGGRRQKNSGRIVLEGLMTPNMNEMTMPYRIFGELTLDEHMDLYEKYGLTPEAEYRLRHNIPNVNDNIMMCSVLNELKERGTNVCLVLRAPVIYRESIVALKIIGLTRDGVVRLNEITISECLKGDKIIHHCPANQYIDIDTLAQF